MPTVPLEGLSLSAGPYRIDERTRGDLTVRTFLFADNQHLAPRYLDASLRHLERFSNRFGSYPFDSFSVVENFFPTGYGFPSYTLIGGTVLRLPFIPETSLPHEIIHNWWGNGVLVDASTGNWCEGLTTYTADYLLKESLSAEAAQAYRRQALRNYATLVSPSTDFSLSRFRSRIDPPTKAVGYDKASMVFHMLRQKIGDEPFWQALRDLYARFLFKTASWEDLQRTFQKFADQPLDDFFDQWITRPGAPHLRLEKVRHKAVTDGYLTTGRVIQEKPYFDVTLQLMLETAEAPVRRAVHLSGRYTSFAISSTQRPRRLIGDPQFHLFRRLAPEEMPPTVNTLKGSPSVIVVIADRLGRHGHAIAGQLSQAMGIDPVAWMSESDVSASNVSGSDVLFIGLPQHHDIMQRMSLPLDLNPTAFGVDQQQFSGDREVLFFVARHPDDPGHIVAMLHPLSTEAVLPVIRKVPHYGRYSYLVFSNGRNRVKGTWEADQSPLIIDLETTDHP